MKNDDTNIILLNFNYLMVQEIHCLKLIPQISHVYTHYKLFLKFLNIKKKIFVSNF